ncbi:MAG: AI-2E family transporter [Woeseia sp.]|nr:AI-2E family transporter [Woeseia sp.]MBT8095447.1 AI-2E family transporter [Woeseia sp.]NNE61404.1 AI-2E family transporter [Woeseia sp.]NNL55247.1 AI-2E family transporter [Woeseia sp.]
MNAVTSWFRRQLANPQVVTLSLALLSLCIAIYLFGGMLAPVLAAIVFAYLLQGIVGRLSNAGMPHAASVGLVFVSFLAFVSLLLFGLLPPLVRQVTRLVGQVPQILDRAQILLLELPKQYPNFLSEQQIQDFISTLGSEFIRMGQPVLSYSMSSLVALLTIIVYVVLVPLLVFFMIRDKDRILAWFADFLPHERQLTNDVWQEVDGQLGNYVRGKFWEILIVGVVAFIVFSFMRLQYALLLAVLTGVSVLIPYIGAAAITVPVALVALFQWGLTADFYYVLLAYAIIQALDGNLLAPLLFSEVVNLHPVAIIVAILFFGGIWGFWGVFFAIPLATLINAVLRAWPGVGTDSDSTDDMAEATA